MFGRVPLYCLLFSTAQAPLRGVVLVRCPVLLSFPVRLACSSGLLALLCCLRSYATGLGTVPDGCFGWSAALWLLCTALAEPSTGPALLLPSRYASDLGEAARLAMANIRLTHQVPDCCWVGVGSPGAGSL